MNIRKATSKDIDTLSEFEKEIAIISFGDDAVTDLEIHKKKIEKAIKMKSDGMFVITSNENICGWLWMDIKSNFLTNEKYVNFRSFFITENVRATDYSLKLMEHGMKYCKEKNVTSIVGKVNVNNIPMRMLYKNFNFKPTHLTMEYSFKDDNRC